MAKDKPGCIGRMFGCLFSLILTAAICGGVFFAIQTAWKSIGAYEHAMERTRASKKVTKLIGTPVKEGIMILPSIQVEGQRRPQLKRRRQVGRVGKTCDRHHAARRYR